MRGRTSARKLRQTTAVGLLLVALAAGVLGPAPVLGCGGLSAYITDRPNIPGAQEFRDEQGRSFYRTPEGSLLVATTTVKISTGLAEAIARRFLALRFPTAGPPHFHGLVHEHGSLAYMFESEVPGLAVSAHVGPLQYATDHYHFHVDAITGDVYDLGCGLGTGEVALRFEPELYLPALARRWVERSQFPTDFVVPDGRAPKIDGAIDPAEWADAIHRRIRLGTTRREVLDYG